MLLKSTSIVGDWERDQIALSQPQLVPILTMSRNLSKEDIERIVDDRIEQHLSEQNSASITPQSSIDENDPEQWPYEVMTGSDIRQASQEQLSPDEYVKREYGVDPERCETLSEFHRAIEVSKEGSDGD